MEDFENKERRINMFEVGDYVVYGTSGVCRVEAIEPMQLSRNSKKELYYTLDPIYDKGSTVFTPISNTKIVIRPIVSAQDANKLIDNIKSIDLLWIRDEKKREDYYKEALKTCDCTEWVKIIKTLYLRKKERKAEGKKVTFSDENYLHLAEQNLYGELAIALGMKKDQIEEYIEERIG